jgi:hypothetical protein
MGIEPGDSAADTIPLVVGFHEVVAFVFVDDELGFNAQRFEGVPEFVGLGGGAFAVTVADDDERGRFHVFDEGDR